jgi:hypothetical protein
MQCPRTTTYSTCLLLWGSSTQTLLALPDPVTSSYGKKNWLKIIMISPVLELRLIACMNEIVKKHV